MLDPESAPEPKFDVPPTPVRLTAFVPPLELMLAKVALRVTAFATIADPPASGEPPRQLKGFTKVSLGRRHSRRVTLTLDYRSFAHWDTSVGAWRADPGCYGVLVGRSSRDLPLRAIVAIDGARCSAAAGVPVVRIRAHTS